MFLFLLILMAKKIIINHMKNDYTQWAKSPKEQSEGVRFL